MDTYHRKKDYLRSAADKRKDWSWTDFDLRCWTCNSSGKLSIWRNKHGHCGHRSSNFRVLDGFNGSGNEERIQCDKCGSGGPQLKRLD
jgi:hypothetical protein